MIFLNLLNRIFGPKKPLSRQEIENYKEGTGKTHDIESKLANSDFNEQAMQGWEKSSLSVNDGMSKLDAKMKDFTTKNDSNGSGSTGLSLTFILFTLTMLALIIFTYQGNSAVEKKPQLAEVNEEEFNRVEEIEYFTAISPEKQITSNELIENQSIQKIENKSSTKTEETPETVVIQEEKEVTQEKEIQLPIQSSGKIPNSNKNTLFYKNAKEVYLSDLKNVDYRAYRNRPIKVRNTLDVGIPASQSSKDDKEEFPSLQIIEITYIDYLTTSSETFSNGEYKKALKSYLTILDTYPEDVNANFYGGLCYFNLGQFEEAKTLLKKSYTLGYGNFREEARWFSARANYEQNNNIKAKYLLNEIISEGGFYSKKAEELLNKID